VSWYGPAARRAVDGEALGAVAGGDVGVQLAARRQGAAAVEGVAAAGVADVEVDVVGVGLPVEDEAGRRPGRQRELAGGEGGDDGRAGGGRGRGVDRAEDRRVVAEDAEAAAVAVAAVRLIEAGDDGGEGVGRIGRRGPGRRRAGGAR
jgi:hypothetical protein